MARVQFRLDRKGIAEILKSPQMRDAMNRAAVQVAANVRSDLPKGEEVKFTPYTTDRRAASVSARGRSVTQAERAAALIRAAQRAGLEVHERNDE